MTWNLRPSGEIERRTYPAKQGPPVNEGSLSSLLRHEYSKHGVPPALNAHLSTTRRKSIVVCNPHPFQTQRLNTVNKSTVCVLPPLNPSSTTRTKTQTLLEHIVGHLCRPSTDRPRHLRFRVLSNYIFDSCLLSLTLVPLFAPIGPTPYWKNFLSSSVSRLTLTLLFFLSEASYGSFTSIFYFLFILPYPSCFRFFFLQKPSPFLSRHPKLGFIEPKLYIKTVKKRYTIAQSMNYLPSILLLPLLLLLLTSFTNVHNVLLSF